MQAAQDRAEMKARIASPPVSHAIRSRTPVAQVEVSGAGCPEVNGVFYPSTMSSYYGPTLYQKPNSRLFLFRWQQRHWVIASLSQDDRFSDLTTWYYRAPAQGMSTPVDSGYSLMPDGCGQLPPPEITVTMTDRATRARNSLAQILAQAQEEAVSAGHSEILANQLPNQCRCNIM